MSFTVSINNGSIISTGRPLFISSTKIALRVQQGQNRRHILHGSSGIIDVLIASFNRILVRYGIYELNEVIDQLLVYIKSKGIRFSLRSTNITVKIAKVITIAFSKIDNLAIGPSLGNQGIQKARESIITIRWYLNQCCIYDIRSSIEIKRYVLLLLASSINNGSTGAVSRHSKGILQCLYHCIMDCYSVVQIIRLLHDFEFSCTLDILHEGMAKHDNIWGLNMFNSLQRAIEDRDESMIYELLL